MPNPYHYRARIDRLWRTANSDAPAYKQLKALKTILREMFSPNPNAARNHALYHATDPYDVARHLLRDLHDRPSPPASNGERCHATPSPSPPASSGGRCHAALSPSPPASSGGRCPVGTEGGPPEDQPPDEDDDPL